LPSITGIEATGQLREFGDRRGHPRHARGVDVADVLVGVDRVAADHLDLAAVVGDERAVVEPDDAHALELVEAEGQRVGMLLVAQLDGDLADRLVAGDRDRRHVADQAAVLEDPGRDLGQLAGHVRDPQPVGAVHRHQRDLGGAGAWPATRPATRSARPSHRGA
jgi:hypothetical protein